MKNCVEAFETDKQTVLSEHHDVAERCDAVRSAPVRQQSEHVVPIWHVMQQHALILRGVVPSIYLKPIIRFQVYVG